MFPLLSNLNQYHFQILLNFSLNFLSYFRYHILRILLLCVRQCFFEFVRFVSFWVRLVLKFGQTNSLLQINGGLDYLHGGTVCKVRTHNALVQFALCVSNASLFAFRRRTGRYIAIVHLNRQSTLNRQSLFGQRDSVSLGGYFIGNYNIFAG